ncbi:MAG: transposase [Paludibacter sp.]|nr:transposase [Paludibacter sp.]
MFIQGYEDTNEVLHLQKDPLFKDILCGDMAYQPTLCRFENSIGKQTIFHLCYACRPLCFEFIRPHEVIINIDATDDTTFGDQQLLLFNGYYRQTFYVQRAVFS